MPRSAAIHTFSMRMPDGVSATCTISPTQLPNDSVKAKPLALPAGSASPHFAIAATLSTTAIAAGNAAISLRRIATGSTLPATATSSRKLSWKKPLKELPTERHAPTGMPISAGCATTR